MHKFIITIEYILTTEADKDAFAALLGNFGKTVRVTEHTFLLVTSLDLIQLKQHIVDSDFPLDRIFMCEVRPSASWKNSIDNSSDIKSFFDL